MQDLDACVAMPGCLRGAAQRFGSMSPDKKSVRVEGLFDDSTRWWLNAEVILSVMSQATVR